MLSSKRQKMRMLLENPPESINTLGSEEDSLESQDQNDEDSQSRDIGLMLESLGYGESHGNSILSAEQGGMRSLSSSNSED